MLDIAANSKAIGGAGAALIGGALAKVAIRVISYNWPSFLDPTVSDAIDDVFTAGVVYFGTWLAPHSKRRSRTFS